ARRHPPLAAQGGDGGSGDVGLGDRRRRDHDVGEALVVAVAGGGPGVDEGVGVDVGGRLERRDVGHGPPSLADQAGVPARRRAASASSTKRSTSVAAGTSSWMEPAPCPAGMNSISGSTSVSGPPPRWLAPSCSERRYWAGKGSGVPPDDSNCSV